MTTSNRGNFKVTVCMASVLLLAVGLSACDEQNAQYSTSGTSAPASSESVDPAAPSASSLGGQAALPVVPHLVAAPSSTVGEQWEYRSQKDPMSEGAAYFAAVESTNTVEFGFPYSGAQHATLTVRSHPRYGKDIIFSIERGQFLCPSYDGCEVLVRFDDAKAIRYHANAAADNSTETIFIRGYSAFLQHLEKSKRVRIAANIYQQGVPVFEFDVSGFDVKKYVPENNGK